MGFPRTHDAVNPLSERKAARRQRLIGRRRTIAAWVVGIATPLLAMGIYWYWAHRGALEGKTGSPPATVSHAAGSVEAMAADIGRRIQQQMDEAQRSMERGRAHMAEERYGDAALAFQRAHRLVGDRPDLLVNYAEALALAHGSQLAGPPSEILNRALELAPNHTKALWLAGFAAFQEGNNKRAIARWRQILTRRDLEPQIRKRVVAQIARTEGGLQAKAPTEQKPVAEARLRVRVALDPSLAGQAAPDDTVFVFVRAPQGPRAPIAVTRFQVKDLPRSFEIDDSMSMVPQLRLSQFPEVFVAARMSQSGDAIARSGDLQGTSGLVKVAAGKPVEVIIDQKVP